VHYLAGKKYINRFGKCHSGLARLEISKIYACCTCSMRRKTTSLTVLPVYLNQRITLCAKYCYSPPGFSDGFSDLLSYQNEKPGKKAKHFQFVWGKA
jgi:hypothetical protein